MGTLSSGKLQDFLVSLPAVTRSLFSGAGESLVPAGRGRSPRAVSGRNKAAPETKGAAGSYQWDWDALGNYAS